MRPASPMPGPRVRRYTPLRMAWIAPLFETPSIAGTMIVLFAACAVGLAVGSVRVKGIGLGVAGVLFAGILAGNLAIKVDDDALHFIRDFGLILFVFGIGLQIGPGFLASLRRSGLKLNLLAGGIVVSGTVLALLFAKLGYLPGPASAGLLSGATTNTPSLAAAHAALADAAPKGAAASAALATAAYALAYPGGVIGTIVALVLTRLWLRPGAGAAPVDVASAIVQRNLIVTNPNLEGVELSKLPIINETSGEAHNAVVVTRHLAGDKIHVPTNATVLHQGDMLLAVGPPERLDQLRLLVGCESPLDLREYPSEIVSKRLVVTRREVLGKTLRDLALRERYGVTVSRVGRAGVEMTPPPEFSFSYADAALAVGPPEKVQQVAALLGDSPKTLDHPQLIPIFLGIALGVVLGSVPLALPGLPGAVRLGLAAGPLLVAIVLSRVGRIGPLVCYLPLSANFALREIGISLFLACVGLSSGASFVRAATSLSGLGWLAMGAVLTLVPLFLGALAARRWLKLDHASLGGLLAGSMTDPPALAYASMIARSDSPAIAYTTVYPLTMILRVVAAQVLVVVLIP